jgi:hypothetical protein
VRVDVGLQDAHEVNVVSADVPHQILHLGGGGDDRQLSRHRGADRGVAAACRNRR